MKNLFIYTFAAATLCLTSCEKEKITKADGFAITEEVAAEQKQDNNTGKYYLTSQSVAQWNGLARLPTTLGPSR